MKVMRSAMSRRPSLFRSVWVGSRRWCHSLVGSRISVVRIWRSISLTYPSPFRSPKIDGARYIVAGSVAAQG